MPLAAVFSTSVEVFLNMSFAKRFEEGLLHVRGGVSSAAELARELLESSPRPWRCFSGRVAFVVKESVFSTSVEVFLKKIR